MNDSHFFLILGALVVAALVGVMSFDMGQRSKELDCATLGKFTVRQPSILPPAVYTCKRET